MSNTLNKLAVLAFSLLLFFGAMLWYLADNSLNDFIKSQVIIQGEYYTEQSTNVAQVSFNQASGVGVLHALTLANPKSYQQPLALAIDAIKVTFDSRTLNSDLIVIKKIEINHLRAWQEQLEQAKTTNLVALKQLIAQQLIAIVPKVKPTLPKPSYVKDDGKKIKRGKAKTFIRIENIFIETLEINVMQGKQLNTHTLSAVRFSQFSHIEKDHDKGIVSEQLAAILLDTLLIKIASVTGEMANGELGEDSRLAN